MKGAIVALDGPSSSKSVGGVACCDSERDQERDRETMPKDELTMLKVFLSSPKAARKKEKEGRRGFWF